jgi:hypothetical protein
VFDLDFHQGGGFFCAGPIMFATMFAFNPGAVYQLLSAIVSHGPCAALALVALAAFAHFKYTAEAVVLNGLDVITA